LGDAVDWLATDVPPVPTGALSNPTLATLLGLAIFAMLAVFYAMLRGKLRPESTVKDIQALAEARIAEVRADRDARLAEAAMQIQMWKDAHAISEEARRAGEALLRETTLEIGRSVQHVIGALQEARTNARMELESPRDSREHRDSV
jgi:hypothetical protein